MLFIAEDVVIGEGAKIGERPENCPDKEAWGVAVVGAGIHISPKAVIPPKAMIEQDV